MRQLTETFQPHLDKTPTGSRTDNCKGSEMPVLVNAKIDSLLESTSRSFYPTLKYLPKKIRGQLVSYILLARVADTIADSKYGETAELKRLLSAYNDVAQGKIENLTRF